MTRNSEGNFYLKPAGSKGISLIFLNYKYSSQRLQWGLDGLYVIDNAYNERGSRPIAKAQDNIFQVTQGGWYGFPVIPAEFRLFQVRRQIYLTCRQRLTVNNINESP